MKVSDKILSIILNRFINGSMDYILPTIGEYIMNYISGGDDHHHELVDNNLNINGEYE